MNAIPVGLVTFVNIIYITPTFIRTKKPITNMPKTKENADSLVHSEESEIIQASCLFTTVSNVKSIKKTEIKTITMPIVIRIFI